MQSCNREPKRRFIEHTSVSGQDTFLQIEGKKENKPYIPHNSVIVISGYRDGEYWVVKRSPNGSMLRDTFPLNIPADTLQ